MENSKGRHFLPRCYLVKCLDSFIFTYTCLDVQLLVCIHQLLSLLIQKVPMHISYSVGALENVALHGKIYIIKLLLGNFKKIFWVLFCSFVDSVRDLAKGTERKSGRKLDLCLAESHEDLFSATAWRHVWWTSESWFSSDCCYGNHTGKPQRQQSCDSIFALALPSSFCNATRVRKLFRKKKY